MLFLLNLSCFVLLTYYFLNPYIFPMSYLHINTNVEIQQCVIAFIFT